jgi:hypothetical protein
MGRSIVLRLTRWEAVHFAELSRQLRVASGRQAAVGYPPLAPFRYGITVHDPEAKENLDLFNLVVICGDKQLCGCSFFAILRSRAWTEGQIAKC